MTNPSNQAQSENDRPNFPTNWTAADEASYLAWVESTLEGQQELEDLYWSARAASIEHGEDF